jgi:nicotinamidase-related amidase
MTERIWDRYLTERDRAHVARHPAARKGAGDRPALLLVDLYRWAFGDRPEPLMDAIERWPGSCGLAGWEALPHIQRLLAEARRLGTPVIHIKGGESMPGWRDATPRGGTPTAPGDAERRRRRYEIIDEVAPIAGEVVLEKASPSAFWGTPLVGLLNGLGVDTLVVAGESTSGCVRATVVDAKANRYRILVPEECVFDRHEAPHAINLFDLDQKYADVIPLAEVLDYLATRSTGKAAEPAARPLEATVAS